MNLNYLHAGPTLQLWVLVRETGMPITTPKTLANHGDTRLILLWGIGRTIVTILGTSDMQMLLHMPPSAVDAMAVLLSELLQLSQIHTEFIATLDVWLDVVT